jgi:hypothetical protein
MLFQNTAIDTILIISIIAIIALWMYQNNPTLKTIAKNSFNTTLDNNTSINLPGVIVNDVEFPAEHNKARLLANQRGVAVGFHEQFKRTLPELGWRSFYLRNFNGLNNLESENKPKTVADNYMSCLSNTDNVYKYVDY